MRPSDGGSGLVWFGLLHLMGRFSGYDHPPCEGAPLSPLRRGVAIGCLALFLLEAKHVFWSNFPLDWEILGTLLHP